MKTLAKHRHDSLRVLPILLALLAGLGGCTSATLQAQVDHHFETAPKDRIEPGLLYQPTIQNTGIRAADRTDLASVAVSRTNTTATSPEAAISRSYSATPRTHWTNLPSDESVQQTLERWAGEAGWELKWTDAPQIHNSGTYEITDGDFLGAATQVLRKTEAAAKLAGVNMIHTVQGRILSVSLGIPSP